jgi:hypothetical protein
MRPRGRKGYEELTAYQRSEYRRVLAAVSRTRTEPQHRLASAATAEHTTPATVRKWLPEVIRRDVFGRLTVTAADRAFRPVSVIARGRGVIDASTHGSRRATLASRYAHALDLYRAGLAGPEVLTPFEGKRIGGVELETDPDRIDDLDATGLLDDFEFYGDLP